MAERTAILILLGLSLVGGLAVACGGDDPGRAAYDAGRFEEAHAAYVAACETAGDDVPAELLVNRAFAAIAAQDFRDAATCAESAESAAVGEVAEFATFLRGNAAFGLCELAEVQANTLEAEPFAFDIAISFGESARDHWIAAATGRDDWPAARRNVERAVQKLDVLRAKRERARKLQERRTEKTPEPEPEEPKVEESDDPAEIDPALAELSEAEVARLLERLAEKEQEKTDLRREHRKTAQAGVEKDW
ncbi:MAG: hypothetical protein ABFS86_11130 [Planctomycetota bacterium]